ncbi:hypothetical protein SVAN01_01551 [Stagonosporopsis vannaccii]|nr:hypothetical protein SVAN01_01551 [Stagonosporopsis vannaccii]
MSSYGSAHSGQLHPGYLQQQRTRSHSNPPYPTTPGTAPYPQQQQQTSYFPPPPTAPYQQAPPTSNPIAIPASNRKRASSDFGYGHGYGTSPSHPPPSSPYANSYPTQHLQPIPQQHPIPENYQYSPQQQPPNMMSGSPGYQHHRRRSSSSQYGYNPRQSYESAHSYQSAHSQPSPDYYARPSQDGHGSYGGWHGCGNETTGHAQVHATPEPPKGYGDWDKEEVSKYQRNQDLERRPTLGGSLMSLVKKFGGSERR